MADLPTQLIQAVFGGIANLVADHWVWLIFLLGLSVLGKALRRPQWKGRVGEAVVLRALRRLDPARYHVFHDLYLPRPDGKGTTQIDHVVVSPFGIFVIETKNFDGWIFGDVSSRRLTQSIYGRKSQFQNPLHQNGLHIRALSLALDLPRDRFHNVVYFVGNAVLKTPLPDNVLTRGLRTYLLQFQASLISPESCARISAQLSTIDRQTDRKMARKTHLANLKERA